MDMIVGITGFKGVGKTTLALDLTYKYLTMFKPEIDFKNELHRFIAFDPEQIKNNLLNEEDGLPLIADEAVQWMMAEDWAKAESRILKKLFTLARLKHRIVFVCIPEFFWIDRKYREDMILFWIHVVGRGMGVIFTLDTKIGAKDKWHREEFEKISSFNVFTPPEKIINIYRKHPCFFDGIKFNKIDENIYNKYLKLRNEALMKAGEEKPKEKKMTVLQCLKFAALKSIGFSNREIAVKMEMDLHNIDEWSALYNRFREEYEQMKIQKAEKAINVQKEAEKSENIPLKPTFNNTIKLEPETWNKIFSRNQ
jgi:hypothetical protein